MKKEDPARDCQAQAPHGSGLGKTRWPIKRSLSWLHQFRRLRTRFEKTAPLRALMLLAVALICYRRLSR